MINDVKHMSKTTAVILHFTSALLGLLSIGMFLILNTHITVWLLIAVDSIPTLICGTVSGVLQIRSPQNTDCGIIQKMSYLLLAVNSFVALLTLMVLFGRKPLISF